MITYSNFCISNFRNLESKYNSIEIKNDLLSQGELDLNKGRNTNPFQYKGQFSPDLIKGLINTYAKKDSLILDPFVGCGTTLFEALKLKHSAIGMDINPAGIIMAKTILFSNLNMGERNRIMRDATQFFQNMKFKNNEEFEKVFITSLQNINNNYLENILFNVYMNFDKSKIKSKENLLKILNKYLKFISNLPSPNKQFYEVHHLDARDSILKNKKIDLIITSPPYINVFNYHQHNRNLMESIGFDILKIAKSEFGSNRKHRQNRFLTVTQYILDMANVIRNLRKNLSKEGRFIIIIGRQSKIRGVPFRNDLIIGMLGMMLGYKIALHQERKFKNQFGVEIYEDIIHFKRSETQIIANEKEIRKLAEYVLSKSTKNVEDETIKKDIILAINKIKEVSKSEILKKMKTPHLDKIKSALKNPKAKEDLKVLQDIMNEYLVWTKKMDSLKSKGDKKLEDLIKLLNEYKDNVEVKLILGSGSSFLTRQKGQLKLDNSIMEEFLIRLMDSNIIPELKGVEFITGPHKAFMSLAFRPQDFTNLGKKPEVIIKTKDNDFILGKKIHYKFSSESDFNSDKTHEGEFALAVIAAECKVNFDKTMFQECSGTAGRLKEGVPYAKYYTLVEFLDMAPEDCKLTDIDNVFLIRKAKRLPYEKRNNIEEVSKQRKSNPISYEVMLSFVNEIRNFLSSTWYNPNEALPRGSFN